MNQTYQVKREIFFSSKEKLDEKKVVSLRLKDNESKLNTETIKQEKKNELVYINKDEINEEMEWTFIEDVPQEWSFKTEESPVDHFSPHPKEELFKKQFHSDPFVYNNEHKEKAVQEWKRFYDNRSTVPLGANRIPKGPMNFYFNGDWGADSIHLLRELPMSELFSEKGLELLTELYERELPKLERNKKHMELVQQRMERVKELQLRIRSKNINKKTGPAVFFIEQEPFVWANHSEPTFNDEQQHKKQYTIVIEQNGDRWIHSEYIRKDSTHNLPVQQKRKVLEIIQL